MQIIVGLAALLAVQGACEIESAAGAAFGQSKSQELIEGEATSATRSAIEQMFDNATKVEVYFTPADRMGRVGFSRELAEQRAKFYFEYRCHAACGIELRDLRRRLSTGRSLQGDCPRPISTVMRFSNLEAPVAETIFVSANGQCFSFLGNAYYVIKDNSIGELVEGLRQILVP